MGRVCMWWYRRVDNDDFFLQHGGRGCHGPLLETKLILMNGGRTAYGLNTTGEPWPDRAQLLSSNRQDAGHLGSSINVYTLPVPCGTEESSRLPVVSSFRLKLCSLAFTLYVGCSQARLHLSTRDSAFPVPDGLGRNVLSAKRSVNSVITNSNFISHLAQESHMAFRSRLPKL